jgi:hypothetical protein
MRYVEFQLKIQAIDHGEQRTRITTGGPLASNEAAEALHEAVDAAKHALNDLGFTVVHSGYGVTAFDA